MKYIFLYWNIFFELVLITPCFCQKELSEIEADTEIIGNQFPEEGMDETDLSELPEYLNYFYIHPLNLNEATREDLERLYFLSDIQINSFLSYRQEFGDLLSVFELIAVNEFDSLTIQKLLPFINVEKTDYAKKPFRYHINNPDRHDLMLRMQMVPEEKKGFGTKDSKGYAVYPGDPMRLLVRYRYIKTEKYSFGITLEKDPGERYGLDVCNNKYVFDYHSMHILIRKLGRVQDLVAGDFSLGFGQGLIFGSGMKTGTGNEPASSVRKIKSGIRPIRSARENKDFSGMAITADVVSGINCTMFYSMVNRDAVLYTPEGDKFVKSIKTSGLHRTYTEESSRDQLREESFGFNVHYSADKADVGINMLSTGYNHTIKPDKRMDNQYAFQGNKLIAGSMYVNARLRNCYAFGEMAYTGDGGKAYILGLIASFGRNIQFAVVHRHYDERYHSIHGNAYGENSEINNEAGTYWGLKIQPLKKIFINAYIDIFRFPWLKYQVNGPSDGHSFYCSVQYKISGKVCLEFRQTEKRKARNMDGGQQPEKDVGYYTRNNFRIGLKCMTGKMFSMGSIVQWNSFHNGQIRNNGFVLAQDLNMNLKKISISSRFAVFNAGFDNRIYLYEKDLYEVYTISMFHGSGVRFCVTSGYKWSDKIIFWLKFARTKYIDREIIGSGNDQIDGNRKSYLGVQVQWKW